MRPMAPFASAMRWPIASIQSSNSGSVSASRSQPTRAMCLLDSPHMARKASRGNSSSVGHGA
jgi:hypothetical protein